jgi:RTX calcium-binding nonapeptide repeat (4 copies)
MSKLSRTIPVVVIAATALMATASQAGAAVTIGQLAPASPPTGCSVGSVDFAQVAVNSGNAYVVPPLSPPIAQVVTSWSHSAKAGDGQTLKMKIWRPVMGLTYMVVGHDGPRPLTGGAINTFQTSIPVQPGDILGINSQNAAAVSNACLFSAPGDPGPIGDFGDEPDGAQLTFLPNSNVSNFRVNATATVESDCDNDGLGDETQDTDISSCAPGTTPPGTGIPPPGSPPGTPPVTCKGVNATIVGTNGNDVRTGSQGKDVIAGLGGNDALSGIAGNDVICGGAGKDTLKGGKGKDTLLGQKGKDALKGGGGRDLCKGGKGNDTASKCEVEKSI